MSNEPTWRRAYLDKLAALRDREAGQTGLIEAWKAQVGPVVFPVHSPADLCKLEPASPRIDEMTLADYRRGVANMKTRYV